MPETQGPITWLKAAAPPRAAITLLLTTALSPARGNPVPCPPVLAGRGFLNGHGNPTRVVWARSAIPIRVEQRSYQPDRPDECIET